MSVARTECFGLCFLECEDEIASEPVVAEPDFVLECNAFGGARLRECERQLGEGEACAVACAEFDFGWFGVAVLVADFGARFERELVPCRFEVSVPFGAVAVFAGFDASCAQTCA